MNHTLSQDLVESEFAEAASLAAVLCSSVEIQAQVMAWARTCSDSLGNGGVVFFAGNGGSFADAQHLAAELTGKLGRKRPPLSAIALGSNGAATTAISNDYDYHETFAREFSGLRREHSVVIAMSTSGNSKNILNLIEVAQASGTPVMGLTGGSGGTMATRAECLVVPHSKTARIQEAHKLIGHIVCLLIEEQLAGRHFEWDK